MAQPPTQRASAQPAPPTRWTATREEHQGGGRAAPCEGSAGGARGAPSAPAWPPTQPRRHWRTHRGLRAGTPTPARASHGTLAATSQRRRGLGRCVGHTVAAPILRQHAVAVRVSMRRHPTHPREPPGARGRHCAPPGAPPPPPLVGGQRRGPLADALTLGGHGARFRRHLRHPQHRPQLGPRRRLRPIRSSGLDMQPAPPRVDQDGRMRRQRIGPVDDTAIGVGDRRFDGGRRRWHPLLQGARCGHQAHRTPVAPRPRGSRPGAPMGAATAVRSACYRGHSHMRRRKASAAPRQCGHNSTCGTAAARSGARRRPNSRLVASRWGGGRPPQSRPAKRFHSARLQAAKRNARLTDHEASQRAVQPLLTQQEPCA